MTCLDIIVTIEDRRSLHMWDNWYHRGRFQLDRGRCLVTGVHYWYWVTKINIDFILCILHTVPGQQSSTLWFTAYRIVFTFTPSLIETKILCSLLFSEADNEWQFSYLVLSLLESHFFSQTNRALMNSQNLLLCFCVSFNHHQCKAFYAKLQYSL